MFFKNLLRDIMNLKLLLFFITINFTNFYIKSSNNFPNNSLQQALNLIQRDRITSNGHNPGGYYNVCSSQNEENRSINQIVQTNTNQSNNTSLYLQSYKNYDNDEYQEIQRICSPHISISEKN